MPEVYDLDEPKPSPEKKSAARKPIDLSEEVPDEKPAPSKAAGKLEILKNTEARHRTSVAQLDREAQRRRQILLFSLLGVAALAALIVFGLFFLGRKPTFQNAAEGPLPMAPAPAVVQQQRNGPSASAAPVIPNARRQEEILRNMPGFGGTERERSTENAEGGIH